MCAHARKEGVAGRGISHDVVGRMKSRPLKPAGAGTKLYFDCPRGSLLAETYSTGWSKPRNPTCARPHHLIHQSHRYANYSGSLVAF